MIRTINPFFFQPFYHEGRYLVDGGLVNPVPTSIIVQQGANAKNHWLFALAHGAPDASEKMDGDYEWIMRPGWKPIYSV